MAPIKTIIFDLGGVILNIDYRLTIDAFIKLGIEDFREIYTKARQDSLFDNFEEGKISAQEFRDELAQRTGLDISSSQIDEAWNAMIRNLPESRLALLEELRNHKQLLLLSNTNEIHLECLSGYVEREYGMERFSSNFDEMFFSHLIGMRKPHAPVFEFVLHKYDLRPEETLFIDDSGQHIRGAEAVGINTIKIDDGDTIEELREQLIHS